MSFKDIVFLKQLKWSVLRWADAQTREESFRCNASATELGQTGAALKRLFFSSMKHYTVLPHRICIPMEREKKTAIASMSLPAGRPGRGVPRG